jgi:UDP-glucose 4-epimerase
VTGRRILITGLSSQLGGLLAQALEREAGVEAIIGIDSDDPRHELQRTEFVRLSLDRRPLRRILAAAAIDTVIDTRLIADPLRASLATIRAVDVDGTAELVAACADAEAPVRRLVFKSSAHAYGWEPGQPAFLTEELASSHSPRSEVERAVLAAEQAVEAFRAHRPECRVAVLRVADELGAEGGGSLIALLSLPVVPAVLGVDPRFQIVHVEDVVAALAHATQAELDGAYNVAADGVLALSEIASLLGKPLAPVLPPWGTGFAVAQLRRLGLRVPVELARQLRYGRGLDNRRLKASGFAYRYTTREAIVKLRAEQRVRPQLEAGGESYRYDPNVEEFLRWSPSVQTLRPAPEPPAPPQSGLDGLAPGELIDLIPSLEPDALETLRRYELTHQRREAVLEALDDTLARKRG